MLIREPFSINSFNLIRTYSDLSVYIRKIKLGGQEELYTTAIDPLHLSAQRLYEETNRKIPKMHEDMN